MKTIAYLRVSTDTQLDGYGLDAQAERIGAYAKALDLTLDKTIVDEGHSGATLDRPGLRELIAMIEAGEVSTVIVYRIDRISRSLRNLLNMWHDVFERHGCSLVSVSEQFDTSTATGRLFFNMVASFAEYERETIRDRLKGGRIAKARSGDRATGAVPIGYRSVEVNKRRVTIVDEREASTVRQILDLRTSGKSFRQIAEALNAAQVPPKRGKAWYASTIRAIVENPIYRGFVEYRVDGQTVAAENERLALV